jgi:hypothetical protein
MVLQQERTVIGLRGTRLATAAALERSGFPRERDSGAFRQKLAQPGGGLVPIQNARGHR